MVTTAEKKIEAEKVAQNKKLQAIYDYEMTDKARESHLDSFDKGILIRRKINVTLSQIEVNTTWLEIEVSEENIILFVHLHVEDLFSHSFTRINPAEYLYSYAEWIVKVTK